MGGMGLCRNLGDKVELVGLVNGNSVCYAQGPDVMLTHVGFIQRTI